MQTLLRKKKELNPWSSRGKPALAMLPTSLTRFQNVVYQHIGEIYAALKQKVHLCFQDSGRRKGVKQQGQGDRAIRRGKTHNSLFLRAGIQYPGPNKGVGSLFGTTRLKDWDKSPSVWGKHIRTQHLKVKNERETTGSTQIHSCHAAGAGTAPLQTPRGNGSWRTCVEKRAGTPPPAAD